MPAFDPTVDPFAPVAAAEQTPSLALDETLAQLLTSYNLLANAAGNVQVDGLVGETVTRVIRQLADLQQEAQDLSDVLIPLEVVSLVDQGKNPELFNRSFIDRTASENQYTHSILAGLKDYRDDYARELAIAFPALAQSVDVVSQGAVKQEPE